ncbi:peptide deformylase [uncultured Roseobacter sp.]|uniref:peptide deformylase n=1 Tax=uncultured Roseobacter sp. TaxID=114847 RepID=UPI0026257A77|nr:peptide deformylase [uncultured Roseobacter sp.]
MTVRDIVRWPDPRLSTVCAPVAAIDADLRVLAADMLETMYAAPGRGLAGPQVGAMSRIFVMDTDWKEGTPAPLVFINPVIEARSAARATQTEGCLSIPGVSAEIERPAEITVAWTDLEGAHQVQTFTGFAAACVQHELDHLDGIVTFDHLTPEMRARLEAEYAEAVQ